MFNKCTHMSEHKNAAHKGRKRKFTFLVQYIEIKAHVLKSCNKHKKKGITLEEKPE